MTPPITKELIMNRTNWMKLVAVAMLACATTVVAAQNAPVKGNPDSKVYHKAACRHYSGKGSTKEFKTEAEAIKAGYTPCKQCAAPEKKKAESAD